MRIGDGAIERQRPDGRFTCFDATCAGCGEEAFASFVLRPFLVEVGGAEAVAARYRWTTVDFTCDACGSHEARPGPHGIEEEE